MATRVVMPKLTDTMEEGVVLKWKKREGDEVASGDVLAEIETDKAVMDLEAFGSGTLRKVLAQEGETVQAGALIAVIAEPDESIDAALKETTKPEAGAAPEPKPARKKDDKSEPQKPERSESPEREREAHVKASPRAKALAAERGVDLTNLKGSGPDGRIIERDILEVTQARQAQPTEEVKPPQAARPSASAGDRPLSQMRKAIARTMIQSKAPIPHFYLTTEIAMEEAERLRTQWKQARKTHPSVTDLVVKAAALALDRHPEINVSYADDKIRQHGTIDIGIAVALEDGLIAPVLRDCGGKTLEQISIEAHALIELARTRQLKPEQYTDATFTVSNLGMYDVDNFIAVLVPPQAASLAVGAVKETPVADGIRIRIGRRMKVTLSCDHRVLDGVQGAKFLVELKQILEHPLELVLAEEKQ
jgi:pyruvate dehydrogenase E2 component (dihydrolipoamide acetyltransferase)